MITYNNIQNKLNNIINALNSLLQSDLQTIQEITELVNKKAKDLAVANNPGVNIGPADIMQGLYVEEEHQRMIDEMARKYEEIQSDLEKLERWQEVTSNELNKYFSLGASESTLKSLFSDRWFCQSASEACVSVSIVGTTGLVTGDMSKVYKVVEMVNRRVSEYVVYYVIFNL